MAPKAENKQGRLFIDVDFLFRSRLQQLSVLCVRENVCVLCVEVLR